MNYIIIICRFFYTLYLYLVVTATFLSHYIWCHLADPFFKDKQASYFKIAAFFLRVGFRISGISVKINGLENLPKNRNFIIASNHQSYLDTVVLIGFINRKLNFFAKIELLKIPLLSWNLKNMGHFLVNRGNPKQAIKQMKKIKEEVEEGKNVLIFPEGTRSIDKKIAAFKRGTFVVSVQTGTPIIPCYLKGTGDLVPKKGFLMKPGHVEVMLDPPIHVEKASKKEEKQATIDLMEKTRAVLTRIEKELS